MLKKEDFTYFIKSLYDTSSDVIPGEERVKLAKQVAEIFLQVGDYGKAEKLISEIKDSEEFDGFDYELQYEVLNTLFRIKYKQGDFKNAESILQSMLQILQKHGDEARQCFVYVKLGNVFTGLQNYDKAIEHYSKSIEIGERIDEKRCLATAYNNIAVYHAAVEKKYDEALIQFQKALSLYETVKPGSSITASIMVNLGSVFKHKGMFDKALDYYQRAHSIAKELHKYNILAHIYKEKAEIYFQLGELEISKVFADRALSVFNTIDGHESKKWIAEIYMLMGKILHKQGASFEEISSRFEEASNLFDEHGAVKELINLYELWSEIAFERGLRAEARNLLQKALEIAENHKLQDSAKELKAKLEYL